MNVRMRPHRDSLLLRTLGRVWPRLSTAWVSWGSTIWYPNTINPFRPRYAIKREHEMVCLRWCRAMGSFWYVIFYLVVPGGRWLVKRDAYLRVNIERYGQLAEQATEQAADEPLGPPLPRRLMLNWFRRQGDPYEVGGPSVCRRDYWRWARDGGGA